MTQREACKRAWKIVGLSKKRIHQELIEREMISPGQLDLPVPEGWTIEKMVKAYRQVQKLPRWEQAIIARFVQINERQAMRKN